MRTFVQKHLHKIIAGHSLALLLLIGIGVATLTLSGSNLVALLASATSSLTTSSTILYFTPYNGNDLQVGETDKLDININTHVPVNAVGITIKFPQDMLDIVGVSKEKSFLDLWTEETAIKEETGEVHFSGGTLEHGGLNGTSTALTLSVRAKKAGQARIFFEDAEVYASDGKGVTVDHDTRSFTYTITDVPPPLSPTAINGGNGSSAISQPTVPNADFNGDGKINLVDMSILVIHMLGSYDARYDLDMDGTVGLGDLSVLLSKMR